ncbi:preprotein translocase subunit SecG [bacterium]|nr:preprotein translocase subunit SecG [bacterium]
MLAAISVLIWIIGAVMAYVTLTQNTKSEGLGAAITGQTDSYRGATGVEEQKKKLLSYSGYAFIGLAIIYMVFAQNTWG